MADYLVVAQDYEPGDVEAGVLALFKGKLAGFDGRFRPSPTQFSHAIRLELNARVDREAREKTPALPPPDVVHTAEERARVKALVAGLVSRLEGVVADEAAQDAARRAERQAQMDRRFQPSQDPEAMSERLLRNRMNSGVAR